MTTNPAKQWIVLGDAIDRHGTRHDVGWPVQDMYTHGEIYGTTGSGKTTLMNNLIQQLIMSNCITVVLTPHADMIFDPADGLLARMPPKYAHRVVLIDPSQPYLPQLSLTSGASNPSKTIETLLERIRSMEPASWEKNAMMRQTLTHAVRALVTADGTTTMSDVDKLLKDDVYRAKVVRRIPEMARETKEYWEAVNAELIEKPNMKSMRFDPAQRRVDGFMTNDPLKWSLSLPPLHKPMQLNFHKLLQQDGPLLVLVPLLEHKIGPVAMQMIGNLIVNMVVSACIARPPAKRIPTLLFIDELPNVIGTANIEYLLSRIFAEFRKFALGTFVAFQSPDQLPTKLRKDISSLANTKIVMKVKSAADRKASVEALGHPQIRERDIQRIPKFGGYALTMINRQEQPAYQFSGKLPLDYAAFCALANPPQAPEIQHFDDLLRLQKMTDYEARIQALCQLPDSDFFAYVRSQHQVNLHVARRLYAQVNTEKDRAKRVQMMTELALKRHGFHWTWYETWYRRRRFDDMKKQQTKGVPTKSGKNRTQGI